LNQALAYAGAFFATWFFLVCYLFSVLITGKNKEILEVLATFFVPLQGKSHARTTFAVVFLNCYF